eukprot:gene10847-biopygen12355
MGHATRTSSFRITAYSARGRCGAALQPFLGPLSPGAGPLRRCRAAPSCQGAPHDLHVAQRIMRDVPAVGEGSNPLANLALERDVFRFVIAGIAVVVVATVAGVPPASPTLGARHRGGARARRRLRTVRRDAPLRRRRHGGGDRRVRADPLAHGCGRLPVLSPIVLCPTHAPTCRVVDAHTSRRRLRRAGKYEQNEQMAAPQAPPDKMKNYSAAGAARSKNMPTHHVLFCYVLLCYVLFGAVLFCFVVFCSVMLCYVMFCSVRL